MGVGGQSDKETEQREQKQHHSWIWQYFILKGQEPWSELRVRLPEVKVESEGSSDSEMQKLKKYFHAVTDKHVLMDAVAVQDGFRRGQNSLHGDIGKGEDADDMESSARTIVSWQ